jgi:hypothetical protein
MSQTIIAKIELYRNRPIRSMAEALVQNKARGVATDVDFSNSVVGFN